MKKFNGTVIIKHQLIANKLNYNDRDNFYAYRTIGQLICEYRTGPINERKTQNCFEEKWPVSSLYDGEQIE